MTKGNRISELCIKMKTNPKLAQSTKRESKEEIRERNEKRGIKCKGIKFELKDFPCRNLFASPIV